MGWTATEVIEATAARSNAEELPPFTAVCTDSRRAAPGTLFVALAGPNHDGHEFVAEALGRGAVAAVVERVPAGANSARLLIVDDTLRALGDLAAWTRRRQPLRVVGITGSNGKTTTKEMVSAICAHAVFPPPRTGVLKTMENENNLIGLPLTLLRLTGAEAVAVLEMGMNAPGEIARMTAIADPDVGVITNVAAAHLEGLGSIAGVAAAKQELYAGMDPRATIVVNADDEWVTRIAEVFRGRRIEFGRGREVEAGEVRDSSFDGITFDLAIAGRRATVRLRIPGLQTVQNALAAAGAAHALGLDLETIRTGLEAATTPHMRMEVTHLANGTTLINDAYNANPGSMEAAIRLIAQHRGRSIAVLGEMRELGDRSTTLHRRVGTVAAHSGVGVLVAVGPQADAMARGAREAGMSVNAVFACAEPAAAAAVVIGLWRSGDAVIVKGSRGSADETVVRQRGARMAEVVRLLEEAGGRP